MKIKLTQSSPANDTVESVTNNEPEMVRPFWFNALLVGALLASIGGVVYGVRLFFDSQFAIHSVTVEGEMVTIEGFGSAWGGLAGFFLVLVSFAAIFILSWNIEKILPGFLLAFLLIGSAVAAVSWLPISGQAFFNSKNLTKDITPEIGAAVCESMYADVESSEKDWTVECTAYSKVDGVSQVDLFAYKLKEQTNADAGENEKQYRMYRVNVPVDVE